MGAKRTDTTDGAYRKARKQFLLEWGEACHWCRRREAVQVDHVIPVDAGIDPTDQSNWVGSCARCNAKRGADYLANKRAGIIKARLGGTTPNSPADVFCTPKVAPPTPLGRSLSRENPAFFGGGRDRPRPLLAFSLQRIQSPFFGGRKQGPRSHVSLYPKVPAYGHIP